jgi:hypothetical protein
MMMNYMKEVMSYPKLEILFYCRKIAMAVLKATNVYVERTCIKGRIFTVSLQLILPEDHCPPLS